MSRKPVHGVGINDADYITQINRKVNGKKAVVWTCPFYRTWRHMLERCYDPAYSRKFPTYSECRTSEEWLTFSNFKAWMEAQDWEGKHLDKDLLVPGNKIYSAFACVFIPLALNMFITNVAGKSRGVRTDPKTGRAMARCTNPFTGDREYLGMFDTLSEAHEAWRQRKHELACQYADMQTDPRIAQALRTRFAPQE